MADFAHLHAHTEYSLLDGLSKIPKFVTQAKIMGMHHLAITDHGGLYGAIKFYKACREEGINPIIGSEMYIAKRKLTDKETGVDNESYHLTVLARDYEGYQNLMKLITVAHLEGFYYRPRIDREILAKYSRGLVALSGCNSSELANALIEGDLAKAEDTANSYRQILGKENYFFELQRHEFDKFMSAYPAGSEIATELARMHREEQLVEKGILTLAKKLKVDLAATNDVHYINQADAAAQDVIVCIQTGKTIADTKRLRMVDSPTFYLKSPEEMTDLFSDLPQALKNTQKIAESVKIDIPLTQVAFPKFDVPGGKTADQYLRQLCFDRIKGRVEKITDEIKARLEYELSVITQKGYSTYFLVVADFVNWARGHTIISTTRGSASGSLVAFALGITTVNPLFFKLPFERFLNLYRPTLPDIDVDFADNRRDEVIAYVREKYGRAKVAQIGTFGTMMARAAVRDVARVLGWPYTRADKLAKMIPIGAQGFSMSLATAMKINKELGSLYQQDSEVKELLDLAQKVEGNARHVSVHAAGVVIAPEELTHFTPLQKETSQEKIITQYDMHDVEEVGLVKMDFLGIRNLSILGHAVDIVQSSSGKKIKLEEIPLDDKKAYELLSRGATMGLFQLGGAGMTRYLKELKPTNVFDIMAMISLFRPGPMNSIPEFIERKHNPQKISYFDPRMKDYLDQSYGVIVYQDDVLLTAINIAGYTWEEADKFRKAMGKKIPAEMTRQREKFVDGCVKNGMSATKAEQLFKLIEPFAAYGFNKAHAASYAVIAYQTAYMKANFPVEFMTAVATAESDDAEKIAAAVAECTKMKIPVLPPDVNTSKTGFTIEKTTDTRGIRFGLSAIKNVGHAAIEAILAERDANGEFKSPSDFIRRVNLRVVNRKTLESLIKAGAMDRFGRRNAMLKMIEDIKSANISLRRVAEGQGALFENLKDQDLDSGSTSSLKIMESTPEAPQEEILSWERELLGFYLSEHPLSQFAEKLAKVITGKINEIDTIALAGKTIKLGGIITSVRKTFTRIRQEEMCFIRLTDMTGAIEVIVFPKVFQNTRQFIMLDQIVVATGRLEADEKSQVLIAENIKPITSIEIQEEEEVALEVSIPKDADRILLSRVYQILKENPGDQPTYLILPSANGNPKKMPVPFGSRKTPRLERQLISLGCQILS